jgi:hypothetical protein
MTSPITIFFTKTGCRVKFSDGSFPDACPWQGTMPREITGNRQQGESAGDFNQSRARDRQRF